MEIVAFDKLELTASEIYYGLVKVNEDGDYYYYTEPWKEKIYVWLPPHVIRAHNTGNLRTLTLFEHEVGPWTVREFSIYLEETSYMRKQKLLKLTKRKKQTL